VGRVRAGIETTVTEPAVPTYPAEQSLLGAILIGGFSAVQRADPMTPSYFASEQHRLIWNAITELVADGVEPDLTTVEQRLELNGKIGLVGGTYLAMLLDRVPAADNVAGYARMVRESAALRRIRETRGKRPQLPEDASPEEELAAEETALGLRIEDIRLARQELAGFEKREYEPPPGLWLGYPEMLAERRDAANRFQTGLRLFDQKLEGGLFPGVVVAIQGPPAAGKTGLATQLAVHLARAGCAVGALYADEGLSGAAVMLGQQFGASRVPLMAGNPEEIQRALDVAETLPFFKVMRPSHHKATLEEFVHGFDAIAPRGMQRVWLLDSAQTLRLSSRNGIGRESQFDRIARAVEMVRDLTLEFKAICLLVSRVNRAAYAPKKDEDRADPLAASWGVALEYFVELLVNLEGKPTLEKPRTALRVSKNRVSAYGNFLLPLDMDFPRHGFIEVDAAADEAEKEAARLTALGEIKERIVASLTNRDGVSSRALEKEVKGGSRLVREARTALALEGRIYARKRKGPGGGEEWFLGQKPTEEVPKPPIGLFDPPKEDPE
jgi:hypothetical protein